jgi:hypothetical protein
LVCLGKVAQSGPDCCTTLHHTVARKPSKKRAKTVGSHSPACITRLHHKPSERPSPSSGRSAEQSRPFPPGLIVRGRVFHVRVRVPRHLEAKIGQSHVTRSLATSYRREAVRRSRIVLAEFEEMFLAAESGRARTSPRAKSDTSATSPTIPSSVNRSFDALLDLFLVDPSKHRGPRQRSDRGGHSAPVHLLTVAR